MSYQNNNKPKLSEINIDEYVGIAVKVVLLGCCIGFILWFFFCVYKPKERSYIKQTRYAYRIIEQEAKELFKKDGYVFSKDDSSDKLCLQLANKYSKRVKNCTINRSGISVMNFQFDKKKVAIYGLNAEPYEFGGTLVKDIIIDINGDKGENLLGVDRTPVSIYSSGRLGGMLVPVSCKAEDVRRYGIRYSHVCSAGVDINFLDTKIPLSYSIMQIGGKNGNSRYISRNVSFLRADCAAFGSDLLGAEDFCESRGYHWLTACYHDYYCAIELTEE